MEREEHCAAEKEGIFDAICHINREKRDEKFYKMEYFSGTIEYNKLLRKEVPHV